jgi:hypothetical protein
LFGNLTNPHAQQSEEEFDLKFRAKKNEILGALPNFITVLDVQL